MAACTGQEHHSFNAGIFGKMNGRTRRRQRPCDQALWKGRSLSGGDLPFPLSLLPRATQGRCDGVHTLLSQTAHPTHGSAQRHGAAATAIDKWRRAPGRHGWAALPR